MKWTTLGYMYLPSRISRQGTEEVRHAFMSHADEILGVGHVKKSCQNQKSKGMPESLYASDGGEYAIAMVVSL